MATALWTFETLTTTGFEADTDVNLGLDIQSYGDGPPLNDAVPVPSVPGETGNGRLLCSMGKISNFATAKEAALAYTSGQPITLTFQWRPLLEYRFAGPQTSMMGFNLLGFNGTGMVGLLAIDVSFLNTTTPSEYDLKVTTLGSPSVVVGQFNMTLRDWNEFEMSYDGAGTVSFSVNSVLIGTVAYSPSTAALGQLIFGAEPSASKALLGVLDTVSLTIS